MDFKRVIDLKILCLMNSAETRKRLKYYFSVW
jgi:hypothetical protein